MKLQAGKYYKTRGGDKAVVKYVCEDPPQEAKEDERTCFGFIWKDGGECFSDWSWVRSGEWIPWERNPEDLVSEWTEPESQTVYIYRSKFTGKKRVFTFSQLPVGEDWERVGEVEIRLND